MSKLFRKWIIRGALLLAAGGSLFACGCPSPCGLPICKAGCPFSPKNILEAVVVAGLSK